MPRNRLVVLEDHPLVRDAMVSLLVPHLEDVDIIYAGDSIDEASTAIEAQGADLVVLDLDRFGVTGNTKTLLTRLQWIY